MVSWSRQDLVDSGMFDSHLDPATGELDPTLAETMARRGFHVTGYRLELVGYFEGEAPAHDVES